MYADKHQTHWDREEKLLFYKKGYQNRKHTGGLSHCQEVIPVGAS